MHQCILNTEAGKGEMDIAMFYQFHEADVDFVHQPCEALFPLMFIEFTKLSTVDSKLPQAALYANHLFRLMKFDVLRTFVPLIGVVMSDREMLFRLYSISVVQDKWKIAEVDLMRCPVSNDSFMRLLHIMVYWVKYCTEFLCSRRAVPSALPINSHLLLRKNSNVVAMDRKIFKCFDYRKISARNFVHPNQRRDPSLYFESDLTGVELVVDWKSTANDKLQIISYDIVPGTHCPSYVGHMTQVLRKIAQLHARSIVHGDIRFSNIVFSNPIVNLDSSDTSAEATKVVSTIIDFDYSGVAGERVYPERFNLNILDGFRHPGVLPNGFLLPEHDITAAKWMCEQYRPKVVDSNGDVSAIWSLSIAELEEDLHGAVRRLEPYELVELVPIEGSVVVTTGFKGTGSPDAKCNLYKPL
jgi:hypothetical protein